VQAPLPRQFLRYSLGLTRPRTHRRRRPCYCRGVSCPRCGRGCDARCPNIVGSESSGPTSQTESPPLLATRPRLAGAVSESRFPGCTLQRDFSLVLLQSLRLVRAPVVFPPIEDGGPYGLHSRSGSSSRHTDGWERSSRQNPPHAPLAHRMFEGMMCETPVITRRRAETDRMFGDWDALLRERPSGLVTVGVARGLQPVVPLCG